jgi:hypothetical protein
MEGNSYVMNGELNTNEGTLNNRFVLYSTPQNALIYLDYVTANADATITAEKGGLLAISTDELMKTSRTLYNKYQAYEGDGTELVTFESPWVNIDNELGVITKPENVKYKMSNVKYDNTFNISHLTSKSMAFGDRGANNSIFTSKLYPLYSNTPRTVKAGDVVDARNLVYYSNITAKQTKKMASKLISLKDELPEGWNGVIVPDARCSYLLISNFKGETTINCQRLRVGEQSSGILSTVNWNDWTPAFPDETHIEKQGSSIILHLEQNHSVAFIRQ